MHRVSGIVPGVMAQTGMETAEIIQGVVAETKPDVVVAIDALAARSVRRLNRTIQITDTGIHPGSRGKSQKWTNGGQSAGKGDWNRCSDGCGCGNDRS